MYKKRVRPNARFQPLPKAEARHERSNCLDCQGGLVYFLVLHLLGLPGRPMLQHGIEHGQKLMHTRGQGDFFDFPRREEPLVKDFDLRVVARGHERAHGQHGAPMRAPSPDRAPTAESPTVTIAGAPRRPRPRCAAV